ncbi:tenascin-like [Pomacea canaliculata]|uniref:tenascin-like n=1 Tax=Pomacea canaliculata TaxID=400727 RepID=UPI000D73C4EB|nr:tenascin-like [Pomacea canaliculata]XP_025111792.1 tenascin-like [Pomacea canaliculata]
MLRFFIFLLSLAPFVSMEGTESCKDAECQPKTWHKVGCSTDDDCDQPYTTCYKRACRCHPGYYYTTQDTCTDTCNPADMQDSFTEYPDSALRANLIGSPDKLTVEACKRRCQTNKRCLTFDFKASGGLCRLHNVTARHSPSQWSPKTSKGWTHYQRSCNSIFASRDNWHNLLCNSKIDCTDINSDCLSGRCLCRPRFMFNQAKKECVFASDWRNKNCSTDDHCDVHHSTCFKRKCRCEDGYFYTTHDTCTSTCSPGDLQDSFTEYPDSALRANLIGSWDGLTLEACKDRCQTDKRCLTFDFKADGSLCRHHRATAHEAPSDWAPKTSKGWTHYQKSCKSTFASHDNWYNLLCNSRVDCHHPHSDCLSGRCLCHSGFHFNEAKKECVATRSCADLLATGAKTGVYIVQLPENNRPVSVWCDMDTAGGGWTVIQRRHHIPDEYVDFHRNWTEYVNGFGNISGDFWLGLHATRALTKFGDWRLRVDLLTNSWRHIWAEYSSFTVLNRDEIYSLAVWGYSGDAGDGMTTIFADVFHTYDRNHYGCVSVTKGAWWYSRGCNARANLNSPTKRSMTWPDLLENEYLKFSEMKMKIE